MMEVTSEKWNRVKKLFEEALQCDPAARGAFLRQACPNDDERGLLENLILSHAKAEKFLNPPWSGLGALIPIGAFASGELLADRFQITRLIARGGMGEVYEANDRELKEDVAIKTIRPDILSQPRVLERFKREVHLAKQVTHQSVCRIFDLFRHRGTNGAETFFVSMELLKGETLAERLEAKGRITVKEAFPIVSQVAHALTAAHDAGILHRDFKPGNVVLVPKNAPNDVRAVVTDFGLAVGTLDDSKAGQSFETSIPFFGTLAYMSPEQIEGQESTRATDIYALGLVIYEMVTGTRPFKADTPAAAALKRLREDPTPPRKSVPDLETRWEAVILKCLERQPDRRFASANEVVEALQDQTIRIRPWLEGRPKQGHQSVAPDPCFDEERAKISPSPKKKGISVAAKWTVYAAILLATTAIVTYLLTRPQSIPKVSGYTRITHDGTLKWLVGTDGTRLFLKEYYSVGWVAGQVSNSGGEVARISTPSPSFEPVALSGDGSNLLAADKPAIIFKGPLWSLPVLGGSPRRLADAAASEAAWSPDGQNLIYANDSQLFLAKADGTEPHNLVSMSDDISAPAWSPDGKVIRFSTRGGLWEVSSDGTNLHRLVVGWHNPPDECCGKWTQDGRYFVFESQGNIWAVVESKNFLRRTSNRPVQLTSGPMTFFSIVPSQNGRKLFVVGALRHGELVRYDKKTLEFIPFLSGISAEGVSFSKDGKWVAYVTYPDGALWRSKSDGTDRLQLSFPPLYAVLPRWSPDGRKIVFQSSSSQPFRTYLVSSDASSPPVLLLGNKHDELEEWGPDWSPDGNRIVFGGYYGDPEAGVRMLDLKSLQISQLPGSQGLCCPRWSPDGRYVVALRTNLQGVVLFDFATQKWTPLFQATAAFPNWSKDGRYIYFLHWPDEPAVMRLRIPDGKLERAADLRGIRLTGADEAYLGLAPDESPLLLRDISAPEVYALDWEAP